MGMIRWTPGRDLMGLSRDMEQLLGTMAGTHLAATTASGSTWAPPMDVTGSDDGLVVSLDLPGMAEDDIEVDVAEGVLTIRGERVAEATTEDAGTYRRERRFGRFERRLRLPDGTEVERIAASFRNGVLTVEVPKPAALRSRRIDVASGD